MTETKLETGQPAPNFSLPDLDGREIHLRTAPGELRIVNFWSAECPWEQRVDLALLPDLARWGARVSLINVASNANEGLALLRQVAGERGLQIVVRDTDHRVADRYAALTTPHFYVIDAAGRLRYQGAYDDVTFRRRQPSQIYLVPVIEALLAGEAPPFTETPTFGCTIVRIGE